MNLLDRLRQLMADSCDQVLDIIPGHMGAKVSIIVSHPGETLVIGLHENAELIALLQECATGENVTLGVVTADDGWSPLGPDNGETIQ